VNTDVPHRRRVELDDSLDFINTLEHAAVADREHIPTLEAALDWLVGRGVLHADAAARERRIASGPGRAGAGRLSTIYRTRAALREVVDAVVAARPADLGAVETLNRTLRWREVIELVPTTDGVALGERDGSDPVAEALARLVEPIAELVAGGRTERLRVCASETCRWVFYDVSRAGKRVWCDMRTCGNRAKARRHRERARTVAIDPGTSEMAAPPLI
jgi:predicted RNA-binding Zn ribbon-like protein